MAEQGGADVDGQAAVDDLGGRLVRRTPGITEWLTAAEAEDVRVVTSSVALVEARDPKVNQARFDFALSQVNIVPPTEAIARL